MSPTRRRARSAAVALMAAAVAAAAWSLGALATLEGDSVDARFRLGGRPAAGEVVVIAVDDVTFSELGEQWPFPRSLHARVIDRLRAAGVRQIGYDVQFTEQTEPREDVALFDAVRRAGNVVLATTEVQDGGATIVLGGDENVRAARARAAYSGLPAQRGGVIRRLPFAADGLETFAVALAEGATGRRVDPGRFESGGAWIDYHGPPGAVPTYSFSSVLRGQVPAAALRGKVVVVGASAPTLQDVHPTPTSGQELMAGPEIQANAASTVLRGLPLSSAPAVLTALAVALLALSAPLASLRLGALGTVAAGAAAGLAYVGAAIALFGAGTILTLTYPLLALALSTAAVVTLAALSERRERERTCSFFGRFVGEQVVEQLMARTDGEPRLGGRRMQATVMFCDLRGFTACAEHLAPERVIEMLNRYLSEMSEAVLSHGGTLVAFMGDGIMAVFGSPIERADHADAALAAAREMAGPRLDAFNAWLRAQGQGGEPFRLGIGLNSGPVMSGNVGSERRLEYAVIGDTTNVAARLEALTKRHDCSLLLSDATRRLLRAVPEDLVALGDSTLPGRRAAVAVWTLAGSAPDGESAPENEPAEPALAPRAPARLG